MKKNKIVYIGYGLDYLLDLYKKNIMPSHLLYGIPQIEKKGIEVNIASLNNTKSIFKQILFAVHIIKEKPNCIFYPFIYYNLSCFIICFLKKTHLLNIKLVGVSHNTIQINGFIRSIYIKFVSNSFDTIFYHSNKNMNECLELKISSPKNSKIIHWGMDLEVYDKFISNENKYIFLSTGKENRDYETLIKAFIITQSDLTIYTQIDKKSIDYHVLNSYKDKYANIHINIIEEGHKKQIDIAEITGKSMYIIVTLKKNSLNYCVGHTSIVEAIALRKPLIVTENPYHPIDVEQEHIGIKIKPENVDELVKAINFINSKKNILIINKMRDNMQELSYKYNINTASNEIYNSIINK